jgi:hypothetical protein
MSAGLVRRIEKLEEEAARESASKIQWSVVWVTEPRPQGVPILRSSTEP